MQLEAMAGTVLGASGVCLPPHPPLCRPALGAGQLGAPTLSAPAQGALSSVKLAVRTLFCHKTSSGQPSLPGLRGRLMVIFILAVPVLPAMALCT